MLMRTYSRKSTKRSVRTSHITHSPSASPEPDRSPSPGPSRQRKRQKIQVEVVQPPPSSITHTSQSNEMDNRSSGQPRIRSRRSLGESLTTPPCLKSSPRSVSDGNSLPCVAFSRDLMIIGFLAASQLSSTHDEMLENTNVHSN